MNITAVHTRRFKYPSDSIESLVDSIPALQEGSVVLLSSKAVAICEGNIMDAETIPREELIKKLSEAQLEPKERRENGSILTLVGDLIVESAGIDVDKKEHHYILLPKDSYLSAQNIWKALRKRDNVQKVGVVITDSHSVPRRRGAIGVALASYGFKPVKEYEGTHTAADLVDGLAAAAVVEIGEGKENTPIAVATEIHNIDFFNQEISIEKLKSYTWVDPDIDVYQPLLDPDIWQSDSE